MTAAGSEKEGPTEYRDELKDLTLNELIEHSDKSKECEKIMLKKEMQEYCQKELNTAKDNVGKKTQNKQQWKKKRLA